MSVQSAQGEDRSNFQAVMPPLDRTGKKLDFVVFKATEAIGFVDQNYASNIALAKQAGVPFGSYHFFHPSLNVDAQVAFFMATVVSQGGLVPGTILACDSEISSGVNGRLTLHSDRSALLKRHPVTNHASIRAGVNYPHHMLAHGSPTNLSASLVDLNTHRFISEVRTAVEVALGSDVCQEMVYTFLSMAHQLPSCTDFPLWLAFFNNTAPPNAGPWQDWTIWQYAGGGGRGGSDQDAYNGDATAFNAWRNSKIGTHQTNGPAPGWETKMLNTIPMIGKGAKDHAGVVYWVTRAQALAHAIGTVNNLPHAKALAVNGTFDDATVAAIKDVQTFFGLTGKDVDGIVGPTTWSLLVTGSRP